MEMPFKNDPSFIRVAKDFSFVVVYPYDNHMEFEGFEDKTKIWKRIDTITKYGRYCIVVATFVGDGCKLVAYVDGDLLSYR